MTPLDAHGRLPFASRHCLALANGSCWLSMMILWTLAGCTSPAIRSQSPEDSELSHGDSQVELIGDENNPYFVSAAFLSTISDFPARPESGEG